MDLICRSDRLVSEEGIRQCLKYTGSIEVIDSILDKSIFSEYKEVTEDD